MLCCAPLAMESNVHAPLLTGRGDLWLLGILSLLGKSRGARRVGVLVGNAERCGFLELPGQMVIVIMMIMTTMTTMIIGMLMIVTTMSITIMITIE